MKYLENEYVGVALGLVVVAIIGGALYVLTPRGDGLDLALEASQGVEETLASSTTSRAVADMPAAPPVLVDSGRPLTIASPEELPEATTGAPYAVQLVADGAVLTSYRWSVNGGAAAFPVPGLGLSGVYGKSIKIVGTPAEIYFKEVKATVPVTFTLKMTVKSGAHETTKQYRLTVNPAGAE